MDSRRRSQAGSNTVLIRAVAVGMVFGLLISGAMFYHKLQLRTLHTVLSSDIDYHVSFCL